MRTARTRLLRRLRARARAVVSLGIAGRLVIAFIAVAALAVAANLIIERGIDIVRTTRLDRARYSPVPPSLPQPAGAAADKPHRAAPAVPAQQGTEQTARIDRLSDAANRFRSAVELRASTDSGEAVEEMRTAGRELDAAAHLAARSARNRRAAGDLEATLSELHRAGSACVESAAELHASLQAYAGRLDTADDRIASAMSSGFRIFGRVIARESLMALHSDIEELRHRFTAVSPAGESADALASVALAEDTLAGEYQRSERGLSRSEGADWTGRMREDIAQMAALRASIAEALGQVHDARARLASSHARLLAESAALHPDAEAPRATPGAMAPRPSGGRLPESAPVILAHASPIVDAVTTTTTTRSIVPDEGRRAAVAAITCAVLATLLAISIWTVRSILVPVGRMLEATKKLARGETAGRIPRGGMKELDSLAVAFNRMAAQLDTARRITQDYRRHLESQVEQRTRQLQHLAERDPLTLLANRRRFFVLLDQSMQRAQEIDCGVAVFFIDLDNFKNLNDGMGHAFGDRVLIGVAQRLQETAAGFGFAARLGGDEFTVVHEEVFTEQDALEAGQRLVEAFRRPLRVENRDVTVSVSVGASLFPEHECRAEDLLSAADAALFRAKALGRNQLAIFTPELLEAASRKFTTEQGIRRALDREEFELVYQPEVRLDTLATGLVEALVRWRLPDGRLAAPDEFLAVTEESGLIIELGDWVLRNAIRTAASWHHGPWPDARVAINVSARQLIDHRFVERVADLLGESRLPASCIELELTESVLQTGAATLESLSRLRTLGVAIALDDFGTGYSSFASLERLPLSRIKLDRTLIADIDFNPRSAAIALALIRLCEILGIDVTAEGVERASQLACLANERTMYLQGYLISRPVAASDVIGVNRRMMPVMNDLLLSLPAERAGHSRGSPQTGNIRRHEEASSVVHAGPSGRSRSL